MPLIKGARPGSSGFKSNIRSEISAGKAPRQAVAIAYSEARRGKKHNSSGDSHMKKEHEKKEHHKKEHHKHEDHKHMHHHHKEMHKHHMKELKHHEKMMKHHEGNCKKK